MKAEMTSTRSPQCELCSKLLLDYIAAGNEVVDLKRRLSRPGRDGFALELLKDAAARKSERRIRLVRHRRDHYSQGPRLLSK